MLHRLLGRTRAQASPAGPRRLCPQRSITSMWEGVAGMGQRVPIGRFRCLDCARITSAAGAAPAPATDAPRAAS